MSGRRDGASGWLKFWTRWMPEERGEWREAMLAELEAVDGGRARWGFALGCAWSALVSEELGGAMDTTKKTFWWACAAGSLLVAPLLYLELRSGGQTAARFPYPLFALLWLIPVSCVLTGVPLVRAMRAGQGALLARPVSLLVRLAFLGMAAWFWVMVVRDQLPCFLGVPNCD